MRKVNSREENEISWERRWNKYSGYRETKKKKETKGFLCSKLAERSTRREMFLSFLLHIPGQTISRLVVLTGNSMHN